MPHTPIKIDDFKARLLVWAARIIRTAAEIEDDPDKAISLGDTARRLEQYARGDLAEEVDIDVYDIERAGENRLKHYSEKS